MQLEVVSGTRYQTKQDLVYRTLRSAILLCQLAPGQRLVIEEIANQLAVSPIPVREALHLLQSEGLVETVPHVGATVARISPSSITEVFTLMEALEVVGTRQATGMLSAPQLAELYELLSVMDAMINAEQHEHWADLNTSFHRTISRFTAMPMLQEITDRVFDRYDRVRRYYFKGVLSHRVAQAQQEHHAIVAAMAEHNYPQLEELVKQHNRNALHAYNDYIADSTG